MIRPQTLGSKIGFITNAAATSTAYWMTWKSVDLAFNLASVGAPLSAGIMAATSYGCYWLGELNRDHAKHWLKQGRQKVFVPLDTKKHLLFPFVRFQAPVFAFTLATAASVGVLPPDVREALENPQTASNNAAAAPQANTPRAEIPVGPTR